VKHHRNQVEEKKTDPKTRRGDCGQEDKNPGGDRAGHPQESRQFMPLINMPEAGNYAEQHGDGIARFAFRRFGRCAAGPIASVAALRVFRQQMSAIRARHFTGLARRGLDGWCVGVLHAHFNSIGN